MAFISASVLAITPFLPWVESHGSGYGSSFSFSANGFACGHGYYILLFAIVAFVLAYLRNKFVFIPGILALIDGISVVSGIGSHSMSFGGASGGAGFAFGPVIVIISSALLIAAPFIKGTRQKKEEGKPIDLKSLLVNLKSLLVKYKFQLLSGLIAILILLPLNNDLAYDYDLVHILLYVAAPMLLMKYIGLKRTYNLFFGLLVFFVIALIGIILDKTTYLNKNQLSISNNYDQSLIKAEFWFHYIFYISILIAFIADIIERVKKEILPDYIGRFKIIFNPTFSVAALLIPFIGYFIYYSSTRHLITNEEAIGFETNNSYFSGDWYFLNKDSSFTFKFQVQPVRSGQRYNEGDLATVIQYSLFSKNDECVGRETIDTLIKYNVIITLPLKFKSGNEITLLKDSILNIKIKFNDGVMTKSCIKNKGVLDAIIQSKEANKAKMYAKLQEEKIEDFILVQGACSDDGCTFIFKDNTQKEFITSSLPEQSVEYNNTPEGGTVVNEKYLNKKYNITYTLQNVHHEASNSDNMEMVIKEMKPTQ